MRKIALCLLALLLPVITVMAQLMPIMEEGKEWVIHTQVVAPFTPVYIYKMKIEGDTVVGATLCKKLHTTKMDASGNILYRSTGYCQQHGDKFYKGNNIMFDMGLEEGGIYRYISPEDYIVTSVRDTVLADGKKRKCMDLNLYYTDGESGEKKIAPVVSDIWVEGIGSLTMGIYENRAELLGQRIELQSVSVNGEYIYQVEPKDTFPGNPIINKAYFTPSEPTTDDEVTFNVELGVFEGNITYNHQVESITGDTINIRASYDKDYGVISVSSLDKPLSLGKLKEGNYEVRYTIKACSGENPTGEEWPFTYRLKVKKAGESIPDTPVQPDTIPADTGQVMPPVVTPDKPDVYVPVIREDDNVTEYPHNPVEGKAEQEFVMSLEGEYLRIKGTLKARGYDKHYIHCQIIGDSVHLQRYDMDPESTDMILHHVDIRIPGFTGNYYHVTLAEQNDIPLYKPYMVASRAVTRNLNGMDDAATALPAASVQATSSAILCTATDAVKLEVYTPEAVKVGEARFANGTATVKVSKAPAMYLYIVTYRDGRRESGKVMSK